MAVPATLSRVIVALLACGAITTGCATLSSEDMSAVQAAETFVVRHGFTDIPHPQNQPVENVKIFDAAAASAEELLAERQGSLQPKAIGFVRESRGEYSVLFRATKDPKEIWGIWVKDGVADRVIHASFPLNEIDWVEVPANNSLQRR